MLRNDTMLYTTLLAKTSHKVITVLNFQSDNSNIPAISGTIYLSILGGREVAWFPLLSFGSKKIC